MPPGPLRLYECVGEAPGRDDPGLAGLQAQVLVLQVLVLVVRVALVVLVGGGPPALVLPVSSQRHLRVSLGARQQRGRPLLLHVMICVLFVRVVGDQAAAAAGPRCAAEGLGEHAGPQHTAEHANPHAKSHDVMTMARGWGSVCG